MSEDGATRYAIYYAPALQSPWWRFGAGWLGRDEAADAALPQPELPGWPPARFAALTAEPRRYGFHATLKAPFRLRDGASEALLLRRLAALASTLRSVPLEPLTPALLDGFIALVPAMPHPAINALAAQCVLALDDLRAPLMQEELARRRPEQLDDVGRRLLAQYGYPHVLARYRFHLTLTGPVTPREADTLLPHAQAAVDALQDRGVDPLRLDRLCVFRQRHPGAPFIRIHDEELAA